MRVSIQYGSGCEHMTRSWYKITRLGATSVSIFFLPQFFIAFFETLSRLNCESHKILQTLTYVGFCRL